MFKVAFRNIFRIAFVIGIGMIIVLMLRYSLSDPCGGYAYTQILCKLYEQKHISGELCNSLCRRSSISLSSCFEQHGYTVFHAEANINLKIPTNRFDPVSGQLLTSDWFSEPAADTSMDEFKSMLLQLIQQRLAAAGDHNALLLKILDVADVNKDVKISMPEARSIWSLLQNDEFFMQVILGNSAHIPALKGFCGDVYALEAVDNFPLFYQEDIGRSFWKGVQRAFSSYHWPSWYNRAMIAIGLLEFSGELYENALGGSLYLCVDNNGEDMTSFGYSNDNKYELRVAHLHHIRSEEWLRKKAENIWCYSDNDCSVTKRCSLRCDNTTHRCTGEPLRPNLHNICAMIADYLSVNEPRVIRADLAVKLDKCMALSNSTSLKFGLEHSLMLTDIQSYLWQIISYPKDNL